MILCYNIYVMSRYSTYTLRIAVIRDHIAETVREHPFVFTGVWMGVFALFFALSSVFGLVPDLETADAEENDTVVLESESDEEKEIEPANTKEDDAPLRIMIDRIGVDSTIVNPISRDIEDLDEALLEGVVHYPGSGDLEDHTNMFLFGHSSGLRVVHNQAFKVFNDLKELESGDLIRIQSKGKEYLYRVDSLTLTTAEEAWVELSDREKKLTLSTCNSFGSKQERYVVEADFVGSYELEITA